MGDGVRLADAPPGSTQTRDVPPIGAVDRFDSTRHLCASAHLDPWFRDHVLDGTVRDRFRAVCPSLGVDLSAVVRHAIVADRQARRRDLMLTGIAVALGLLVLGRLVLLTARLIIRDPGAELPDDLLPILCTLGALLVAAWVVVAWTWGTTVRILSSYLLSGRAPEQLPLPDEGKYSRLLAELDKANTANVIVFSGFDPFVGSGFMVNASSFSVPLLQATGSAKAATNGSTATASGSPASTSDRIEAVESAAEADFSLSDLLSAVESALGSLTLRHVQTHRRLFVNGWDVALFDQLLPDPGSRPVTHVSGRIVNDAIERAGQTVRPYLCVEAKGWSGELVVTSFVRVVRLEGALFVELSAYVLPPLHDSMRPVDRMRIRTPEERTAATVVGATQSFVGLLVAAPGNLLEAWKTNRSAARRQRERERRLDKGMRLDHGALTSVRKVASGESYPHYFLRRDMDMYVKVVQQRLLRAIGDFLDEHGLNAERIRAVEVNYVTNNITDGGDIYQVSNVGAGAAVGRNARGASTGKAARED